MLKSIGWRFRVVTVGAIGGLALAASSALGGGHTAVAAGPDPNSVYIDSISDGGSGCPQGSVGQSLSNDRSSFTLIFDSFVASSGPAVPLTENRKNCQLNVNLHVPAGVSVTGLTFDYRGYVSLPAGVTANQGALYYVGGDLASTKDTAFAGPVAKDYLTRDVLSLDLGCGSARIVPVNINSQVRINSTTAAAAQITTDSLDGKVTNVGQPCVPTKDDCKKGGWQNFIAAPGPFKNQGDCVSYFATGGKNQGSGH